MALVERARHEIGRPRPPADRSRTCTIALHPESTALLVDGDAAYRQFFAAQAKPYGAVELADSGLSALASFKRAPADLVFVGEQLGLIGAEMLVQKLRAMAADKVVRIVAVRDADRWEQAGSAETVSAFDEVMRRSMVEETHQAEMRRFISRDARASAA
jgi:DNA-binding response OmpR family regulator